jgi:hypothetical protein
VKMNKKIVICSILALGMLSGPEMARDQIPGRRFSLKISAGYGSAGFGDLGKAEKGHNAKFGDLAGLWGFTKTGELALPHKGLDLDGEIVLSLTKHLDVGLGFGRLSRSNRDSQITIQQASSGAQSLLRWTTWAAVIPVTLNVYAHIPVSSRLNGFLKAGLGCYFANLEMTSYRESELLGVRTWSQLTSKMRDYALGYHAGLGIEVGISNIFSSFAEGTWRFVNLRNLSVQYDYSSNAVTDVTRTSSSWSVEEISRDNGKTYTGFLFSDSIPTSAYYQSVRKAEIDFSGWSFQAGIRIRFGK